MVCRGSKKGNAILDTISIVLVLFVIAILILVLHHAEKEINLEIQNDTDINDTYKAVMAKNTSDFPIVFDNLFIFILVGLWLVALVAAAFTDSSYLFLVITVVLLILVMIVGAIIANTQTEIREDTDLLAASDDLPKINFIFDHFIAFIIGIFLSIMLVLFGKGAFR